jgi:hypothetical protein
MSLRFLLTAIIIVHHHHYYHHHHRYDVAPDTFLCVALVAFLDLPHELVFPLERIV